MGNVTVVVVDRGVKGSAKEVIADITMSSSYATSGDTIQAADILKILPEGEALTELIEFDIDTKSLGGHGLTLDRTNKKVLAHNGTTEIANATNLSAVVGRLIARYGRRTGSYETT